MSVADVTKAFGTGSQHVVALEGVTLDVAQGEFVCLLGASGCGKSTLLNLVAGLDQPDVGHGRRATPSAPGSCSRRRRCSRGSPCAATSSSR